MGKQLPKTTVHKTAISLATMNRIKCNNNAQKEFCFFGGWGGGAERGRWLNNFKAKPNKHKQTQNQVH